MWNRKQKESLNMRTLCQIFCDYRVSASIPGNPNIRSYGICKKKSMCDI